VTSEGVDHGCTFFIEMPLFIPNNNNANQGGLAAFTRQLFSPLPLSNHSSPLIRQNSSSTSSAILNAANLRQLSETLLPVDELHLVMPGADTNLVPVMRMESDRNTVIRLLSHRSDSMSDDPTPPFKSSNSDLDEEQYIDNSKCLNRLRSVKVAHTSSNNSHSNSNYNINNNNTSEQKQEVSCCGLTVLLVDDVSSCRKMLRRILTGKVACLQEACDGNEAVDFMQIAMKEGKVIDVILMDFVMPNTDGPEATKLIREIGYRGLVIGLTGNTSDSDVKMFLSHGADRVMGKPFELSVFNSILAGKQIQLFHRYSIYFFHVFLSSILLELGVLKNEENKQTNK